MTADFSVYFPGDGHSRVGASVAFLALCATTWRSSNSIIVSVLGTGMYLCCMVWYLPVVPLIWSRMLAHRSFSFDSWLHLADTAVRD